MEWFFTGLLVVAAAVIVWFSLYVVYRLFSDERY